MCKLYKKRLKEFTQAISYSETVSKPHPNNTNLNTTKFQGLETHRKFRNEPLTPSGQHTNTIQNFRTRILTRNGMGK